MVVTSSKWRKSRVQRNRTLSIRTSNEAWCICFDGTFGTMWMAVFGDMGASLLVDANGLRLVRQ